MVLPPKVAGILILFVLPLLPLCQSILPTAGIDISISTGEDVVRKTLFASQASFGAWPAMEARNNDPMTPVLPPKDDPLLCLGLYSASNRTVAPYNSSSKFVIIVPRGTCSFEKKAMNAQKLGASAIIIYGTLASRYSLNTTQASVRGGDDKGTVDDIIYPQQYYDYDCSKASAEIPMSSLSFEHLPYDYMRNDRVLSGKADDGNICAMQNENFASSCESKRCLLTGDVNKNQNTMRACCAWDMHVWLYSDNALKEFTPSINVTAIYITMAQADELLLYMQASTDTKLTIYQRYQPSYNLSSILIWALGVFVASLAAWMSASEYRIHKCINDTTAEETQPMPVVASSNGASSRSNTRPLQRSSTRFVEPEESLELTASHAFGFIVVSTAGLLILFFLKIYNVVKVFYVIGCSGAVFQVIFYPLFHQITMKIGLTDRVAFRTETLELGTVTHVQLMAASVSYGLGAVWIYIAFAYRHPDNILFYWIMQDVMGACMCIMFLSTMKLNSIKVASVLLMAAFFYDIFFVFVTPYLTKGGKSIMVDVATSGGPPKADPAWCEKYPNDKDCQGGDPLPMLLTIPRIFDYMGGSSLLGLGDIVLPGLLLSFAARYDEAKRLIGSSSREGRIARHDCSRQTKDYFPPLIVAYAVGLAMANVAVYVMNMGQPALLYLVPSCLGTMSFLGWRRGELNELWNTPKVLASCDEILYGPVVTQQDGHFDSEVEGPNTTSTGIMT